MYMLYHRATLDCSYYTAVYKIRCMERIKVICLTHLLVLCVGITPLASAKSKAKRKATSGIYGYVVAHSQSPGGEEGGTPTWWVPNCEVIVKRAQDKGVVARVRANNDADFTITLKPGKYIVSPGSQPNKKMFIRGFAEETPVTVWRGFYTEVVASFDGGW